MTKRANIRAKSGIGSLYRRRPHFELDPFWGAPKDWPDDSAKSTFLARAVDRYGRAMFGQHWIGVASGGVANDFPSSRNRMYATRAEVLRAARLLQKHDPVLWRKSSPDLIAGLASLESIDRDVDKDADAAASIADFEFTDEQWDEAELLIQNEPRDGPDPAIQWEAVLGGLLSHFRDETLHSSVRDLKGGACRPLDPSLWDTEGWRPRFENCQLDEAHPLGEPLAERDSPRWTYIYVATHEFDHIIRPVLGGKPEYGLLKYVPTYLDLLLKACRHLDVKPGSKPLNPEVLPLLERIWREAGGADNELSLTTQKQLATVLRPPTPSTVPPKRKSPGRLNIGRSPKSLP